jgi:hypothetical protein
MQQRKGMMGFCAAIKDKTLSLFRFLEHNCRHWKQAAEFVIKCNVFNMQDNV